MTTNININPINKSRKLMTHWSILTFVMTFAFCHNVQGQVNYTYNDTGCCTSRTKAQKVAKVQTALYRNGAKITVIDFPEFHATLSIKADSIANGERLNCMLSDVDGITATAAEIKNGLNTLDTSALKPGIYFLNVRGRELSQSYKLTKK